MADQSKRPVRIGVAGLSHDHVFELLMRHRRGQLTDVEIVGVAEADKLLGQGYLSMAGLNPAMLYPSLDAMLEVEQPEAVMAYGSIFDHRAVVQACAPRGVHVMVEKPLAVSVEHAESMAALADQHGIHLLTNYETTWYASIYAAYERVKAGEIGEVRKVVVHDGHFGPREIGCTEVFLSWLTDPVLNGGGALIDFGCYGANLMTWLMDGQEPETVTAVTQTLKPEVYPKVDDEATIVLTYPHAQAIIQASWNWPIDRKDMEIYGQRGQALLPDRATLKMRAERKQPEETFSLAPNAAPMTDPFSYLAAVVRGEIVPDASDLSALENNLSVVRILSAARDSARIGKTVQL